MNLKEQNQYDLLNDEKLKAQYEINMNKLNATTMPKPRAKVSLINWKSLDIHINYLRKTLNITHNSKKYKQRNVVHKSQKVCLIEMTYARKNFFLEFSNGNNILTFCISIHSSCLYLIPSIWCTNSFNFKSFLHIETNLSSILLNSEFYNLKTQ